MSISRFLTKIQRIQSKIRGKGGIPTQNLKLDFQLYFNVLMADQGIPVKMIKRVKQLFWKVSTLKKMIRKIN